MALADIASRQRHTHHPVGMCVLQRFYDMLPSSDERDALIAMIKSPDWPTSALTTAVRNEYPELPVPSRTTFDNHRGGRCSQCELVA